MRRDGREKGTDIALIPRLAVDNPITVIAPVHGTCQNGQQQKQQQQ